MLRGEEGREGAQIDNTQCAQLDACNPFPYILISMADIAAEIYSTP